MYGRKDEGNALVVSVLMLLVVVVVVLVVVVVVAVMVETVVVLYSTAGIRVGYWCTGWETMHAVQGYLQVHVMV